MILYFENSKGEERIIGNPQNEEEAYQIIHDFCTVCNFKIYYVRSWIAEDGRKIYDVGSHTEFFKLEGENLKL